MSEKKTAIIIGAGPAGLTAAYEFLEKTDIIPVVLEATGDIGGISKTVNYKGNHIDIGGHRFFSKSDRVMDWWLNILPLQENENISEKEIINYQNKEKAIEKRLNTPNPEKDENVMLIRKRKSRIYYLRRFFNYPVTLNFNTVKNLGIIRITRIGFSYLWIKLFPKKNIFSLEDFFISRFGKQLYKTFFKDYTEKVWGVPCSEISAEWGAQRIKGLSVSKAIRHAIIQMFSNKKSIRQKNLETSLIEQFLYPKYGPGHLWNEVAEQIKAKGGKIILNCKVSELIFENGQISKVLTTDGITKNEFSGNYFISSMPVKDLINGMGIQIPDDILKIANGLIYRDFIAVGVLLKKMKNAGEKKCVDDNWIYIQENDVKVGRLQIFNNWSPYMVKDKETVWIGMEYFCNEGDELWSKADAEFKSFASGELAKIGLADIDDVIDSVVIRMPKTYPAYFGSYSKFDQIKNYLDKIENLFLVGRNGMHKYNNQDHSMLTAMTVVENIINGITDKQNIWAINTEQDYHEEKQ
ncbi:MAG: NAD(P)/FAD-dependent oxidoreductase [Bacteroidota bacterium]